MTNQPSVGESSLSRLGSTLSAALNLISFVRPLDMYSFAPLIYSISWPPSLHSELYFRARSFTLPRGSTRRFVLTESTQRSAESLTDITSQHNLSRPQRPSHATRKSLIRLFVRNLPSAARPSTRGRSNNTEMLCSPNTNELARVENKLSVPCEPSLTWTARWYPM
ncbi:hypothetical protein BC835DRAFT_86189 [Cytidiella melzeri]|nr:hypothetical protein BC835DRAFT_86189 [Cytidiella melzeri]